MKKTAIGTVVTLLAFFTAHVTAEVVANVRNDITALVFVPCANGGAGEVVELSGPLHSLITMNVNGNNASGQVHNQPQGISGFGLTTGDTYQGTGVTQDHFEESLQNDRFTGTFVNNFRIIGRGPGNNFLLHVVSHLTVNANGDVAVDHEIANVDCR